MPGTTAFPAALDTFPNIGPNTQEDGAGVEHDVVHANEMAAIAALQVKLGINGSAVPASIDARMAAVESGKLSTSVVGVPNGVADLNASGQIPAARLPSYVDDVLEFANLGSFPASGETGKIYIAINTASQYRWSGSAYLLLVSSPGTTDALAEGTTNLYHTDERVQDAVAAMIAAGAHVGINFSYNDDGNSLSATVTGGGGGGGSSSIDIRNIWLKG